MWYPGSARSWSGTTRAAGRTWPASTATARRSGSRSIQVELPATATQDEIAAKVRELNENPDCTGFIVQLPLPKHVDTNEILGLIDPVKDADGLHPVSLGKLVLGQDGPLPCTPKGCVEILRRYDVPIAGAHVVVVGRGVTAGRPMGLLFTRKSENATVTQCHTGTTDLAAVVRTGDIVIAAAGSAGLITADMVKPGAVLLDVGTSRRRRGQDRRRHRARRPRAGRLDCPDARRHRPDDPRDAPHQRRRGRRSEPGLMSGGRTETSVTC